MRVLSFAVIAILSFLKGCDFGDPAKVEPQMTAALQPYFPKVQVKALPAQHALIGLTCTANVGNELVNMVGPAMASNPKMQDLKLLRMVPGSSYNVVGIGFDRSVSVYNIQTGAFSTIAMGDDYASQYRKQCGLEPVKLPTPTVINDPMTGVYISGQVAAGENVWIGYFKGNAVCGNEEKSSVFALFSLGVWPSVDDLNKHVGAEVRISTERWSQAWLKQSCVLSDVTLYAARAMPVSTSPTAD